MMSPQISNTNSALKSLRLSVFLRPFGLNVYKFYTSSLFTLVAILTGFSPSSAEAVDGILCAKSFEQSTKAKSLDSRIEEIAALKAKMNEPNLEPHLRSLLVKDFENHIHEILKIWPNENVHQKIGLAMALKAENSMSLDIKNVNRQIESQRTDFVFIDHDHSHKISESYFDHMGLILKDERGGVFKLDPESGRLVSSNIVFQKGISDRFPQLRVEFDPVLKITKIRVQGYDQAIEVEGEPSSLRRDSMFNTRAYLELTDGKMVVIETKSNKVVVLNKKYHSISEDLTQGVEYTKVKSTVYDLVLQKVLFSAKGEVLFSPNSKKLIRKTEDRIELLNGGTFEILSEFSAKKIGDGVRLVNDKYLLFENIEDAPQRRKAFSIIDITAGSTVFKIKRGRGESILSYDETYQQIILDADNKVYAIDLKSNKFQSITKGLDFKLDAATGLILQKNSTGETLIISLSSFKTLYSTAEKVIDVNYNPLAQALVLILNSDSSQHNYSTIIDTKNNIDIQSELGAIVKINEDGSRVLSYKLNDFRLRLINWHKKQLIF
jgi:hypothetical protein